MRTRVSLAAAILLAMALSGCMEADYLAPFGTDAPPAIAPDGGNETVNETGPEPEAETPTPEAAHPGTLIMSTPVNATVNETFQVTINYYRPGNEPRDPVYAPGNSTGNGTGNETGNQTVVDPGSPGTPAYYDDVFWTLDVAVGDLRLSFNGTSIPAVMDVVLNQTGDATLDAVFARQNATLVADALVAVAAAVDQAGAGVSAGPFGKVSAQWVAGASDGPMLPDYFLCAAGPSSGSTHATFALPAAAGGRTFTATLTAETGLETVADWGFYMMNGGACDGTDEVFFGQTAAPVGGGVTGTVTGVIPATADLVTAFSLGGAMVTLEIVIN